MASERTIARLSLYRRLLTQLAGERVTHTFSHELAKAAGCTAAQVRRDLLAVGFTGSTRHGYSVSGLRDSIGAFLDRGESTALVLLGVGNLGRALLAYFSGRHANLSVVAAFDVNPGRTNRVIQGCRCYDVRELSRIVGQHHARVGILAVPAREAQGAADSLIEVGITGILNFAPAVLSVPAGVFVEQIDLSVSLEKVVYFSRDHQHE
ncbi:MAG: redox-sensing transcriptional repressor Rex [Planctomycetota bacterium]